MKLLDKLKDFKVRLSDRRMFSVVLTVLLAISGVAIYEYKKGTDYRYTLENQYNRAFCELASSVDNIETSLSKGVVITDPRELVKTANKIYSQSAFASAALAQLPVSDLELSGTSKFLAQVGDYTSSLSLKYMDGGEISDDEYDTLLSFSRYAASLSDSLDQMQASLYSGSIKFGELEGKAKSLFSSDSSAFADSLKNMEEQFSDYPSLIYDGPFSDSVQSAKSKMLDGFAEISEDEATKKALTVVGGERQGEITPLGQSDGTIPSYSFSIVPKNTKDRTVSVDISKQGGALLWMLDNRGVQESVISAEEAVAAGKKYISLLSLGEMKESYYEIKNNICTVNFAATEGDIMLYPDLVKVRVAMDTGEIIGAECRGYLMNHIAREIPAFSHSETEILAALSPKALPLGINKCLIPLDSGREVFCYEVKCKFDDKNFLIYLNAETLRQENILMLLITENGTLTI